MMIMGETFENRRRRIPRAFVLSATLLLSCYKPKNFANSFAHHRAFETGPRIRFSPESSLAQHRFGGGLQPSRRSLLLFADSPDSGKNDEEQESWSRRASSSPLKVRNRVRAVLKRARNRTGIPNSSGDEVSPSVMVRENAAPTVVAEPEATVVSSRENTPEALFSIKKKNGTPESFNDSLLQYLKPPVVLAEIANGSKLPEKEPQKVEKQTVSASTPSPSSNTPAVVEPLPFTLPKLSEDQLRRLRDGERIQEQSKMGNEGSGYVVVDVKAPEKVVWECLLDFESYPQTIPTVRDMKLFTSTHLEQGYHTETAMASGAGREKRHYGKNSTTRAAFVLSKFRLNIAAIHTYKTHPDGDYMIFTLDPSCTNVVLQSAKGIWHTQAAPDGKEDYTRVWLLCELKVSWALPTFIVDYAAKRAMPRATTWLKPQVEAAAELWLKERPNGEV